MKLKQLYLTVASFALVTVILGVLSFKKDAGFTIKGHIDGFAAGTVYLMHDVDKNSFTDSVMVSNGDFSFKGSVAQPIAYTLKLSGKSRQQIFLFVENSVITIRANKDSLYQADVQGSATHDTWKAYQKSWKPVVTLAGKYYHLSDSVNKAQNNKPDSVSKAYLKSVYATLQSFDFKVHQDFFSKHPGSIVCAYIINSHFIPYFQFTEANQLFAMLTPAVKASYYGKQVQESVEIDKSSGIGAKPVFTMADVNGKPVSLSSYRGKYVLVDFWASWCGPCRRENPNVLANYKKYHDQGFEVLGVSLDSKKEPWLKAIETDGLTWTHVSDLKGWNNAAAEEFGVKVVPSNFLLDKDGKVIAKNIREEALSNKLKSIFNK